MRAFSKKELHTISVALRIMSEDPEMVKIHTLNVDGVGSKEALDELVNLAEQRTTLPENMIPFSFSSQGQETNEIISCLIGLNDTSISVSVNGYNHCDGNPKNGSDIVETEQFRNFMKIILVCLSISLLLILSS